MMPISESAIEAYFRDSKEHPMPKITAFDWTTLTPLSKIRHRVNEDGLIVVQDPTAPYSVPFAVGREYEWEVKGIGEEWALRTTGAPSTMSRLETCFGGMTCAVSLITGVDERALMTAIACESGPDHTQPSGRSLKSPRTELGYPGRTGEGDHGDEQRDEQDWLLHKGIHSSHGLMQTLIGTAVGCAPHLFAGCPISKYREVLWDPAKSIEAGARFMACFPAAHLADPVALRFHYASGGVYASPKTRWGARMYELGGVPAEGPCILNWVAFWNDLAEVLGDPPPPDTLPEVA